MALFKQPTRSPRGGGDAQHQLCAVAGAMGTKLARTWQPIRTRFVRLEKSATWAQWRATKGTYHGEGGDAGRSGAQDRSTHRIVPCPGHREQRQGAAAKRPAAP